MAKRKAANIAVFRKKWNINIGVIIFGVVFVYLVVTVLLYLTGTHVTAYEVREGSILKDNAYTGLILRKETVITAEADGYVNFFAPEGSKAGAKTYVYSLSSQAIDFSVDNGEQSGELSVEEQEAILSKTQDFAENFHAEQFGDVYTLKNNITALMESRSNQSRQTQLSEMLASGNQDIKGYRAGEPGIVIYSTDGYETIVSGDVTAEMVSRQGYEPSGIKNNTKVKAGDPVYKVITDDTWTLVIELNDKTAVELNDTKLLQVQFLKDHEICTAGFDIRHTADGSLGFLTFDSAMVRYAGERYLDIELIIENESGLKIPKSSVVKKDFYIVPEGYLTQGGNSKETGVMVSGKDGNAEFKKADIYYRDNEHGNVYLNPSALGENLTLVKPESGETFKLQEKKSLQGVYNINKGYAVFREIEILCESEEYYIVAAGNDYGLANYDHIALVGEDVKENDVVF